jgi:hypothetical protein
MDAQPNTHGPLLLLEQRLQLVPLVPQLWLAAPTTGTILAPPLRMCQLYAVGQIWERNR